MASYHKFALGEHSMVQTSGTSRAGQQPNYSKPNQDNILINQGNHNDSQFIFACIADGYGWEGEKLSKFVVNQMSANIFEDSINFDKNINQCMAKAFSTTQDHIQKQILSENIEESGTTLISLIVRKNEICCGKLGDSRCQILKYEKEWSVVEWSRSHRTDDIEEAERIRKNGGEIRQFEDKWGNSQGHPRIQFKHQMKPGLLCTRVFGEKRLLDIGISNVPEVFQKQFDKGDNIIFMGSDGLFEQLEYLDISEILIKNQLNKDISKACIDVCNKAQRNWTKNEEVIDDISIVVFQIYENEVLKQSKKIDI